MATPPVIGARLKEFQQREAERLLTEFDFSHLVDELYHLTFDDFCDWYLEAIKPRLYGGDADARATAAAALERLLKLLHPAMPHVTEEIWSQFHDSRLIVSPWPEPDTTAGDARALDEVQRAAATFRRSGVLVPLEGAGEAEILHRARCAQVAGHGELGLGVGEEQVGVGLAGQIGHCRHPLPCDSPSLGV